MKKVVKLTAKGRAVLAFGVMAALSSETDSPVADTIKRSREPMTEQEKILASGLKFFDMPDGARVAALNYKNALRKWEKLKMK